MSFRVGQKVIVVNADPTKYGIQVPFRMREKVTIDEFPRAGIALVEYPKTICPNGDTIISWNAWRFRPLVSEADDIALFKSLLTPEGVFEDALMRMDIP